jgi:hypothetical protein
MQDHHFPQIPDPEFLIAWEKAQPLTEADSKIEQVEYAKYMASVGSLSEIREGSESPTKSGRKRSFVFGASAAWGKDKKK